MKEKMVSDLHNYEEVLSDINIGNPVLLTHNGKSKYILLDINDYKQKIACTELLNDLEKGRLSGQTDGWLSIEEAANELGIDI